jgi:choline dehydrogenase
MVQVIVSAGALKSPQILLLSGVGSPAQLFKHGIELASDIPGVGESLRDHPNLETACRFKRGADLVT